jgi:hypothetical protein
VESGKSCDHGVVVLAIIPLIFAILTWLGVGDTIEFSDDECKILSAGGKEMRYAWKDLQYYGDGKGFYMIEFKDNPALQIYQGCYSSEDWSKLMDFLSFRYPDQKADGYIGSRLFKNGE